MFNWKWNEPLAQRKWIAMYVQMTNHRSVHQGERRLKYSSNDKRRVCELTELLSNYTQGEQVRNTRQWTWANSRNIYMMNGCRPYLRGGGVRHWPVQKHNVSDKSSKTFARVAACKLPPRTCIVKCVSGSYWPYSWYGRVGGHIKKISDMKDKEVWNNNSNKCWCVKYRRNAGQNCARSSLEVRPSVPPVINQIRIT